MIGFEKTFELPEWLFVESNSREVRKLYTCFFEYKLHRLYRKRIIMLLTRKALFMRGRDDFVATQKSGSAVVIIGRNAEDILVVQIGFN